MTLYVNKSDQEHEERVLKFLEKKWKCESVRSLEKKASFDGFLHRDGRPTALVEIRRLNCYSNSFPCLLYTSPSPRDATLSRMPSSA